MSIQATALLNGSVLATSTDEDNAPATATKAATGAVRHFITGFVADYSAAVSAIKTITVKRGSTTLLTYRHDFGQGPAVIALPSPLHGDVNEAVSVELAASGTLGTTGRVHLLGFTA